MKKLVYIVLTLMAIQFAAGAMLGNAAKDISDKRADRIESVLNQADQ